MTQGDLLTSFRNAVKGGPIKDVRWGTYAGGDFYLRFHLSDGVEIEFRGLLMNVAVKIGDEHHRLRSDTDNCSQLIVYRAAIDRCLEPHEVPEGSFDF